MSRIADRFGRAASTYETATPIQREVAARLAERILDLAPAAGGRVAEFGCGTGYLARALAPRLGASLWVATDIAPAMIEAARRAQPQAAVAVMDAARPALKPGFDLVCSSLTLQWLADPAAALAQWRGLVRPGGLLAVATLIDGAFAEWRAALAQAGVTSGPSFPTTEQLRSGLGPDADVQTFALTDRHADGLAFLRAARAAGIDAGERRALDAGAMRRALKRFDDGGASVTYVVALSIERVSGM